MKSLYKLDGLDADMHVLTCAVGTQRGRQEGGMACTRFASKCARTTCYRSNKKDDHAKLRTVLSAGSASAPSLGATSQPCAYYDCPPPQRSQIPAGRPFGCCEKPPFPSCCSRHCHFIRAVSMNAPFSRLDLSTASASFVKQACGYCRDIQPCNVLFMWTRARRHKTYLCAPRQRARAGRPRTPRH